MIFFVLPLSLGCDQVDTAHGADFVTFAATDAFFGVNTCKEVFHLDRPVFASLDALHTTDTGGFAMLSCGCALFPVVTKNCRLCNVKGEHFYKVFGTGFDTSPATVTGDC